MYNTFNMGAGLVVAVPKEQADKALEAIAAAGETGYIIGECKTGAKEFLQALRERGIPAVLATATDRAVMMEGLRRTGLLPLLDAVYTCGELGVDKRTPALFHHARAQMGTAIEATWVFEDAVHAAQTAYQAGYRVAGVADPYSDQEALKATCHWYLTDWTDFAGFYQQA
mgnify:FL=1